MLTLNGRYYTMSEAATKLDVTIQRLHVLCKTYDVRVQKIHPLLSLIPVDELRKIPATSKRRA